MEKTSEITNNVPRALEYAPACKSIALIQMIFSLVSLFVTWEIWWDPVVCTLVSAFGYYYLRDINAQLNARYMQYFHYGTCISMLLHVIGFCTAIYFAVQDRVIIEIFKKGGLVQDTRSPLYFSLLFIVIIIEMVITGVAIQRTYFLNQELTRNDFYFDLGRMDRQNAV